jgi:quinol monooxygenase YgiN
MKKIILLFIGILFVSCDNNPNYEKNLATAKKLFELHGEEKLDEQLALVSDSIKLYLPMYDAKNPVGRETYEAVLKGYQDDYEDIKYTAQAWLPGVDTLTLKPDGSVRTYGTWTGKNSKTKKEISLNGYWYFNFDDEGKIIAQGDFFDYGGMMQAVDMKHPVIVSLKVKKGKKQELIDLLNTPDGLPKTRNYAGCKSLEAFFNDDLSTYYIYSNWESVEKYDAYLKWRMESDDSKMAEKVTALIQNELSPIYKNSDYLSFNKN